jgi:hypothetical protein
MQVEASVRGLLLLLALALLKGVINVSCIKAAHVSASWLPLC